MANYTLVWCLLSKSDFLTAEEAVGNGSTRNIRIAADVFERFAVIARSLIDVAEQLVVVAGLDVASMVLEEVGQPVVHLIKIKWKGWLDFYR